MRSARSLMVCAMLIAQASFAPAIDHKNLEEGRPLRLEDAYSTAQGELALESGIGFSSVREGRDQGFLSLSVIYGALPNFQLELATVLLTNAHEIDEPERSGDLSLEALYNFNQETLTVPAFGIKLALDLPTGIDSSGVDVELMGLITKSFGRLSLHFNGGYEFISGEGSEERSGRYKFAFGPSYPVGAPMHTRTTLLADFFIEQSVEKEANETLGAEVGLRYQFTERAIIDTGVGSEFDGPKDRSRFFSTVGFSYAF